MATNLPPVLAADGVHRAGCGEDRTEGQHGVSTCDQGDGGGRRVGGGGDRDGGRDRGGGAVGRVGGYQRVSVADNRTAGGDVGKVPSLGAAGATLKAAQATAMAAETLRESACLRAAGPDVLVERATVQEEATLGTVASVLALATWSAGGSARWAVARAMVKLIKDAAAVVLALDPVLGPRRRQRSCGGRTTNIGDFSKAAGRPLKCFVRHGKCVANGAKQATTGVQQVILPGCGERRGGVRGRGGGGEGAAPTDGTSLE